MPAHALTVDLIALFAVQRFGTGGVAIVFGPVTVVWFIAIGMFGLMRIFEAPQVLAALNPLYAIGFVGTHTAIAAGTFGAVFLAVTGAEALYADLGHVTCDAATCGGGADSEVSYKTNMVRVGVNYRF